MKNKKKYLLSIFTFSLAIVCVFASNFIVGNPGPGYKQLQNPFRLGVLPPECEYKRECDGIGVIRCKDAFGTVLFCPDENGIVCDIPAFDDPYQ